MKDKFSASFNIGAQSASDYKESATFSELKKLDLFDLGVLLIIAATGGLDVFSEESIAGIPNLQSSCCILHAVQGGGPSKNKSSIMIKKVLNRLSTQA